MSAVDAPSLCREVFRLTIDGPCGPGSRFTIATGVHAETIKEDFQACLEMFGPDCHPKLEAVEAKDHDPRAWLNFVGEMVALLKAPLPSDISGSTEHINKLNEIRHRFFVNANVEDFEARLLEMGVRQTLHLVSNCDSPKSSKARGFGK